MAYLEGIFTDLNQLERKETGNNIIGHGTFGTCFIVTEKKNPESQLCAKITLDSVTEVKEQENLLREVVILKNVKHNAIIRFVGFSLYDFDQQPKPTLITEYMPNGSLDKMLQSEAKHQSPPEWNITKKQICIIGVAAAMRHLHRKGLMHRDLKPANVLLDDKLYPKVCDFGFARATEDIVTASIGTPVYMAPEVLNGDTNYKSSVDVYSFAILTYEICTGRRPYDDFFAKYRSAQLTDLLSWVCSSKQRPKFDNCDINPKLKNLIERCWNHNPDDRPKFDDIYDCLVDGHEYVINDKVDFEEIGEYIETIQDDSVESGKAKLYISDDQAIFNFEPEVSTGEIPSSEEERIKMFNNFMQNGFSGDPNLEMTLFTTMLGSISTDKDPKNFVKITYFANKLVEDGNKKAYHFLEDAFGKEISKGKDSFSNKDIPNKKSRSLNLSPTIKTIKPEAFSGLTNLLYINLPPTINELGENAFKGCKNLIWINLNNQITEVSRGAFEDCSNLKYVEFSTSLISIKENAFQKCISLDQIHLPKSVKTIGHKAFHGCKKLKIVHMGPTTDFEKSDSFPLRAQIIIK